MYAQIFIERYHVDLDRSLHFNAIVSTLNDEWEHWALSFERSNIEPIAANIGLYEKSISQLSLSTLLILKSFFLASI